MDLNLSLVEELLVLGLFFFFLSKQRNNNKMKINPDSASDFSFSAVPFFPSEPLLWGEDENNKYTIIGLEQFL